MGAGATNAESKHRTRASLFPWGLRPSLVPFGRSVVNSYVREGAISHLAGGGNGARSQSVSHMPVPGIRLITCTAPREETV